MAKLSSNNLPPTVFQAASSERVKTVAAFTMPLARDLLSRVSCTLTPSVHWSGHKTRPSDDVRMLLAPLTFDLDSLCARFLGEFFEIAQSRLASRIPIRMVKQSNPARIASPTATLSLSPQESQFLEPEQR